MSRSCRFLMLVMGLAIASAGCGAAGDQTERSPDGSITSSGRLGIRHLQDGDCIRDEIPDRFESLVGVPCSHSHRAQVLTTGRSDLYEIDDPSALERLCGAQVVRIGQRLSTRDDLPIIDVSLLYEEGGDRVVCVLEFAQPVTMDVTMSSG